MKPDLSLTDAAARLGVHYMTAYRYVRTGRLEARKVGGEWKISSAAIESFVAQQTPSAGVGPGNRTVRSRARVHLEHRLLAGDEPGAWSVVEDALASGASPDEMAVDVLMPALASVGDRWAAGSLSVADEHRASAVAIRLIGRMGPRFAHRGRKRGTVVVGAPSGERHEMPVALVTNLLRRAGYEVVELGPDTPPGSFAETAESLSASGGLVAVLVGVTMPGCLGEAAQVVSAIAEVDASIPVLIGGAAVGEAETAASLGSTAWTGSTARDVLVAVEQVSGKASR